MTDETGVPENSEDETPAACYAVGNGTLPIGTTELEQEIKELEKLLRLEREERRRIQSEAQVFDRTRGGRTGRGEPNDITNAFGTSESAPEESSAAYTI
ncbi:hypothetical protein GCK32_011411 [Trichostrongylus colubriformis]|uniref:Uncharacterized protein n=1 Tax=Trichostrongylus colubriformis TaxID=6319 RepID=A0AAN8INU9_TRICO